MLLTPAHLKGKIQGDPAAGPESGMKTICRNFLVLIARPEAIPSNTTTYSTMVLHPSMTYYFGN